MPVHPLMIVAPGEWRSVMGRKGSVVWLLSACRISTHPPIHCRRHHPPSPFSPLALPYCRSFTLPEHCTSRLGRHNPGCCFLKYATGWTSQVQDGAVSGTVYASRTE